MKHNFSTYIGFSLSIPIFDAFSTRNSVRQAKLQHLSAQLQLDQQSTDLYKTIQLAYYQACGAREKYLASLSTLEKTRRSFAATQEKYNLGRATPAEFEQAKNNLFRIEISSIQSHYEYLLRHRILIFYQSNRLWWEPEPSSDTIITSDSTSIVTTSVFCVKGRNYPSQLLKSNCDIDRNRHRGCSHMRHNPCGGNDFFTNQIFIELANYLEKKL